MFVFGKKYGFLVMLAPEPLIICSKRLQTRFLESSTLKIWYGALPVTTQAPKKLFWAKNGFFPPFLAKKCVFFVMAALKPLIICSEPCKTHFSESSNLKIGYGALQLTTQAPKTLF